MKISRPLYDEMVSHALAEAPNECFGLVASVDGQAVRVFAAVNAAASPLRYEIDGAEQYRIQSQIEEQGWDLGAIYHSHTRSAPYPSQTDINLAFYPDSVYLIIGVVGPQPEVRAFRIVERTVEEVALSVV